MKEKIFKGAIVGMSLGLALIPFLALATHITGHVQGNVPGPIFTSPANISVLITKILTWISAIIMTIALIMLLFAAFLYLTAGGSEDRVTRARGYLLYAVVGIVIAVLAYSIQPFIESFLQGTF